MTHQLEKEMRPVWTFFVTGFLTIVLTLACPCFSVGASSVATKGKVKLVGRYRTKKIKEGRRNKTYFNLKKSRKLELKASGPVDVVLLFRALKSGHTKCELNLDGKDTRQKSIKVSSRVSLGLFLKIPVGAHRLAVECDRNLWFRPLKSKKGPQSGQQVVAWSGGGDDGNLQIPPLVSPSVKKSGQVIAISKQPLDDQSRAETTTQVNPVAKGPKVDIDKEPEKEPLKNIEATGVLPQVSDLQQLCDQLAERVRDFGPVVVAPFKVHSSSVDLEPVAVGASSYLNTCLKRDHSVFLVEWQQRAKLFKEAELSMTGMVDAQKAAKLGRSMGAKTMVLGSISKLGSVVVINVRAISIEAAKVVFSQVLHASMDSLANVMRVNKPTSPGTRKDETAVSPLIGDLNGRPAEVRLRILADRIANAFTRLPGKGRYERIVVAEMKESGQAAKDLELGVLISAQLSTFLQRDHGFFILERSRIQDALKEIQLGMTGLLDPEKAAKAGKMIGAQAVVVGTVSEAGSDFVVNARLISVETAEVLVAESMNLPRAGMVALSDASVVLRTRSGSIFRSMVIPGWGQFYNREPVKGGIIVGLELALAGAAVATHFLGASKQSEYSASDFALKYPELDPDQLSQKAQELRSDAESYYGARNILIYSAIGVYLYNILDAYLFGTDGEADLNLDTTAYMSKVTF